VRIAVVTNKPETLAQRLLERLFAPGVFGDVVGARPGQPLKPDPGIAIRTLARLTLSPAECLIVGDTEVDIALARAADIRAIGVSWGFRCRDHLVRLSPSAVIDTPDELLEWVVSSEQENRA
jgi:phosphoglycolate phosphatase